MRSVIIILVTCFPLLLAMQTNDKEKKAVLTAGRKLYEKYSCNSCHGSDGVAQGDLRQAYKKFSDEQLKNMIKNPRDYANYKMPVYKGIIPDEDYKALIAYVKWLGEKSEKK
jgi:mono/diheme cytochrome c family protein